MEESGSSRNAPLPTFQELVARESLKKVSQWFGSWREWQRRVFVCRAMEQSSRHQLRVLATVLEPVLHIDFSSSLVPHLASLHADGAATFQVQRGVLQRVLGDSEPLASAARLPSLPTTLASSDTASNCEALRGDKDGGRAAEERVILRPALPLTHARHAAPMSPGSSREDMLTLRHTRFSSVPDFQSTTNLLRDVKRKDQFRPRHHKRSQSLGSFLLSQSKTSRRQKQKEAENFKTQLTSVSQVATAIHKLTGHTIILYLITLPVDAGMACKAEVSTATGAGKTVQQRLAGLLCPVPLPTVKHHHQRWLPQTVYR